MHRANPDVRHVPRLISSVRGIAVPPALLGESAKGSDRWPRRASQIQPPWHSSSPNKSPNAKLGTTKRSVTPSVQRIPIRLLLSFRGDKYARNVAPVRGTPTKMRAAKGAPTNIHPANKVPVTEIQTATRATTPSLRAANTARNGNVNKPPPVRTIRGAATVLGSIMTHLPIGDPLSD